MTNKKTKSKKKRSAPAAKAGFPVNKNDIVDVDVTDGMGQHGEGVGKLDGFTLFIQGALPGERVRVKVLKLKKKYGYAKLLEVLKPSPHRTEAPCPLFGRCGGCQLQHVRYEEQLRLKRQIVIDNLERIGKLQVQKDDESGEASGLSGVLSESEQRLADAYGAADQALLSVDSAGVGTGDGNAADADSDVSRPSIGSPADRLNVADQGEDASAIGEAGEGAEGSSGVVVHPTLGMKEPWHYRNKAQVPVGVENGRLLAGFYALGSHRIIDMDACLIQDEHNDQAIQTVKDLAQELGISIYDEENHRGLLRHIAVRKGFKTGEMMIVLVTNGRDIPKQDAWVQLIREQVPNVASICQNMNTKRTNVIFGEETRVLWGRDVIYDEIGDVRFAISARSFYQVNPVQTKVLYEKALEYAELSGKETVIDAYCGIGTISLFMARHADKVYGVEIVPEAVEDARRNALINDIRNAEFEVGKAEEVLPAWQKQGIRADVIVVDPPRKGCDEALLETILQMKPKRVVYVSCNPSTLARDLRILEDGGYRTVEVQPVDMFPHTVHVESVSLMVRK